MQWYGLACGDRKIFYTTREESFKIPVVRRIIKLLRAIPIPTEMKNKTYFIEALDKILKEGNMVHFYPEAALWPYYNELRNFKTGAFRFAVRNNVPIVPMVFSFREPSGIRKIFKQKQDVTLTILKPIKPKKGAKETRVDIEELKYKVYEKMNETLRRKREA